MLLPQTAKAKGAAMNSKIEPANLAGNLWRNGQIGKAGSFAGSRIMPAPETPGESAFAERTGFNGSVFDQVKKLREPVPQRQIQNPFQMVTANGTTLSTASAPGVANMDFFKAQANNLKKQLAAADPGNAHEGPLSSTQLGSLQRINPVAARRYQGLTPAQQAGVRIELLGDDPDPVRDAIVYVPGGGWSSSQNQLDGLPNLPQGIREVFVAGQGGSFGGMMGIDQNPGNWYLFGGAIDLGSPEMPGAGTASTWWIPDRILWSDMSDYFDYHDEHYYGNNGYDVTLGDLGTIMNHEWNSFLTGMEGHLDKGDPLGMALQFVYSGATTLSGLGSALWNSVTGAFSSPGDAAGIGDALGILANPLGGADIMAGIAPGGCCPGAGAGGGSGSPSGPLQDIVNGGCFSSSPPTAGGGAPASSGVEGLLVTYVSKADAAKMDAEADAAKKSAIANGQEAKEKADAKAKAKAEAEAEAQARAEEDRSDQSDEGSSSSSSESSGSESDSDSQEESGSDSDSSDSGQRRSVWEKGREAVSGVVAVGPLDAYDAARGEDFDAATEFAGEYSNISDSQEREWTQNAARHGVWQARLSNKHGVEDATAIGDAHERGSPARTDSWVDQYNNEVARQIGQSVTDLDDIPAEIRRAIDDGRLIISPSDTRIPEELRD